MEIPFWDKSIETIDRSELEKLQLAGLKRQVENALKTTFYKNKLLKEALDYKFFKSVNSNRIIFEYCSII